MTEVKTKWRRNRCVGGLPASICCAGIGIAGLVLGVQLPTHAQVVYSSNFASGTSGFTAGGDITSLTTTSLPTDAGGINSANQSVYLGEIGAGVAKSTTTQEIASLTLNGLTVGKQYNVAFNLFIGASWDGYSIPGQYGPDYWSLTADGTSLIDTTFSNLKQGVNAGAISQQNYSPTTYSSALGTDPTFDRGTGAAVAYFVSGTDYGQDYTIYDFGNGAGNPVIDFTADSATETLDFARSSGSTDSSDEYWALNNVQVTGIGGAGTAPEPGALPFLFAGTLPVGIVAVRRRWNRR